jgi:hypothetical protein
MVAFGCQTTQFFVFYAKAVPSLHNAFSSSGGYIRGITQHLRHSKTMQCGVFLAGKGVKRRRLLKQSMVIDTGR